MPVLVCIVLILTLSKQYVDLETIDSGLCAAVIGGEKHDTLLSILVATTWARCFLSYESKEVSVFVLFAEMHSCGPTYVAGF